LVAKEIDEGNPKGIASVRGTVAVPVCKDERPRAVVGESPQ
jgi:hypothetical protein